MVTFDVRMYLELNYILFYTHLSILFPIHDLTFKLRCSYVVEVFRDELDGIITKNDKWMVHFLNLLQIISESCFYLIILKNYCFGVEF